MAKQKKTLKVERLIARANNLLSQPKSEEVTTEYKSGICDLLECILLENDSYNGYMHLDSKDCEFGTFGYFSRKYF